MVILLSTNIKCVLANTIYNSNTCFWGNVLLQRTYKTTPCMEINTLNVLLYKVFTKILVVCY